MNYLVSGKVPQRNGNAHPNIQPQDVYACADGDAILVVGNDGQFAKLCAVLGHAEWAQDERFATNAQRVRNIQILSAMLRHEFAQRPRADLIAALDGAGVPCGAINSVPEVFEDPQVKARGMLHASTHTTAGHHYAVAGATAAAAAFHHGASRRCPTYSKTACRTC